MLLRFPARSLNSAGPSPELSSCLHWCLQFWGSREYSPEKKKTTAFTGERQNLTGKTETCSHFKWTFLYSSPSPFCSHPCLKLCLSCSLVVLHLAFGSLCCSCSHFPYKFLTRPGFGNPAHPLRGSAWAVSPDFKVVCFSGPFWPADKPLWSLLESGCCRACRSSQEKRFEFVLISYEFVGITIF